MKFIKIALIASFCIAVFTACSSDTDYCKLQGNDTVGLIKNYDKHNNADILTKTVLEKHLPEMNGNVAFASVEILGEENGKTTQATSMPATTAPAGLSQEIQSLRNLTVQLIKITDILIMMISMQI